VQRQYCHAPLFRLHNDAGLAGTKKHSDYSSSRGASNGYSLSNHANGIKLIHIGMDFIITLLSEITKPIFIPPQRAGNHGHGSGNKTDKKQKNNNTPPSPWFRLSFCSDLLASPDIQTAAYANHNTSINA